MPRVSVVMPSYNSAAWLDRTLASIMQQTYQDFEVVVADDGSKDNTREVVARYGPKVKYLHQQNAGVSAARNLALSGASGEFIAHMDSDDLWYPTKLAKQVEYLDAHPECGVVHTECAIIDDDDRIVHPRFNHDTHRFVPQGQCLMVLLKLCHIQVSSVLERRTVLERVGPFDRRIPAAEDYLRWIIAAMEGFGFGYIEEPLAMYRWRTGSLFQSRSMAVGYVRLYELLLGEKQLEARFGKEAGDLARERLWEFRRALGIRDMLSGKHSEAREMLGQLVRERPGDFGLYFAYAKACLPAPLAMWIRQTRGRLTSKSA